MVARFVPGGRGRLGRGHRGSGLGWRGRASGRPGPRTPCGGGVAAGDIRSIRGSLGGLRRPLNDAVRPALCAHGEELREVARTLGLAYEEGEVKDSRGQHPGAPLFERWVLCENRLSGTIDGAPAAMFDLMTIEGTGEGERRRSWTVIQFAQSRLPFFVCVPRRSTTGAERATLTPINFDPRAEDAMTREAVAAFEKVYVLGLSDTVSASGEDAIRRHFCSPRLEAMAQYPNWHVQSAGGFLVFALSWTAPAADRPALWDEALELRRALLMPLAPGVTSIPAAPGMDVGRQRDRRAGAAPGAWPALCSALSAVLLPLACLWPPGWARRPAAASDPQSCS